MSAAEAVSANIAELQVIARLHIHGQFHFARKNIGRVTAWAIKRERRHRTTQWLAVSERAHRVTLVRLEAQFPEKEAQSKWRTPERFSRRMMQGSSFALTA
jgi:hypothetical protein